MRLAAQSVKETLEDLITLVENIGQATQFCMIGQREAEVDNASYYGVIIQDDTGTVVSSGDITAGTYDVVRMRAGSRSTIVNDSASSKADGRVYVDYNFPNASWVVGDMFEVWFEGIQVVIGTETIIYPVLVLQGRISMEESIETKIDTLTTNVATVDTVVDTIQAVTDVFTFTGSDVKATLDGETTTVGTNNDKTGYSISGAITTLDGLNDLSGSDVYSQILAALKNPVGPMLFSSASLADTLHKDGNFTFDNTTDSLEAIRDYLVGSIYADTQDILTDTGTTLPGEHTAISNAITALNNISTAEVNAEVDNALDTAVAQPPTATSLNDTLHKDGSYTYDNTTDSLEALRDYMVDTLKADLDTVIANQNLMTPKRSADSGSTLMDGTELTLYERSEATPFLFYGGYIDDVGGVEAKAIKVYVKIKSGGTYRLVGTKLSFKGVCQPVGVPAAPAFVVGASPLVSQYGVKVTLLQGGEGGGWETTEHEWFDSAN